MNEKANTLQVENNTRSREDLETVKAELEGERAKARQLVDEATKDLKATIAGYQQELQAKTADIEALKAQLAELNNSFEGAKAAYAFAVEEFKKLAAASNTLIPAEAIYGATVEEVKASIERANRLVASIKQAISERATQTSVPAGAPVRTVSTEALSTTEKITLGLEQARRRKE